MRSKRSPLLIVMMAAALISSVSATHPQPLRQQPPGNCEYFAETGHFVCDEFLQFYKTRGGLEIFGNPITEAFDDSRLNLRAQYFQNTRMELHPSNPDPYKVQLGLLVDELGFNFSPIGPEQIPPFNSSLRHYFPETGHVVSYSFLTYFREKGGLDIFGYPRSEYTYEDGYIVQYFQRARIEWHPEITSGPQMSLTPLGEIYIERIGVPEDVVKRLDRSESASLVTTSPTAIPESMVTKLNVSASVRYVITGREGGQTVFVYVTDQWQQPVSGAFVTMVVRYQSGDQPFNFDQLTNESGFTGQHFEILSASPPGQKVVINVTVMYNNLTGATQTFFLPWW